MRAILCDIDGTLANVKHRLHYLDADPKDWVGFHDAMVDDKPIEATTWIAKMLFRASNGLTGSEEFSVLIVSARHEPYRKHTEEWLAKQGVLYDRLYMRDDADKRADHLVKADILEQIIADGYEPCAVFDDRPEVGDMWESWGLTVYRCTYDDMSKYQGKVMLTLLIGPSGAGKSTLAKKLYKASEIISTDQIREDEGLGHAPYDVAQTFALARGYAQARIRTGRRAVIDATNLNQNIRLGFTALVPKGGLIEYVLVDRDYDDKLANRGWRSEELISSHHRRFRDSTLVELKDTDGLGNVIVIDKREKK